MNSDILRYVEINRISASAFTVEAERVDVLWHLESDVAENADFCCIHSLKARFFLLCPKMQMVSFCSTLLRPYRVCDEHTWSVSHKLTLQKAFPEHYNQLAGSSSRYTWSVLHSPKSASDSYRCNYNLVLVCIHQFCPASAVRPRVQLDATRLHCRMLFTSGDCHWIIPFPASGAQSRLCLWVVFSVSKVYGGVNADIR